MIVGLVGRLRQVEPGINGLIVPARDANALAKAMHTLACVDKAKVTAYVDLVTSQTSDFVAPAMTINNCAMTGGASYVSYPPTYGYGASVAVGAFMPPSPR